ncbi:hypothetical protein [Amycolatopsis benzoatilytica]|uniref:hypothetical protein n=1 Tax=Amycolatopsis benzoatilytica TaxID=346045 RepID=UPI00036D60E4|nr:hypothetical protein [Amycolatopsis benzoatilytica]
MLTRVAAAGLAAAFALAAADVASASGWGSVDCTNSPSPYCQLDAQQGTARTSPPSGRERPLHGTPARPHTGSPDGQPGDDIALDDDRRAHCSYVRSDYRPPPGVTTAGHIRRPEPAERTHAVTVAATARAADAAAAGAWYVYRCAGGPGHDALYRPPVFIPDRQQPDAAPAPSPEQLAVQARSQLRLAGPRVASNPAGAQLVAVPTWLWIRHEDWIPRSATATAGDVSVTATATPAEVTWSMGDGTTETCTGPGRAFTAADPHVASPDCGHTYRRSSAAAPNGAYPVVATVRWTVAWAGTGASGTVPDLTTETAASFRVAEVQALGTAPR